MGLYDPALQERFMNNSPVTAYLLSFANATLMEAPEPVTSLPQLPSCLHYFLLFIFHLKLTFG
jgi:hypothetical protein